MNRISVLLICLIVCQSLSAQTDEFQQAYDAFKQNAQTRYENFRDEVNRRYAEFVKQAWKEYKKKPAIPKPKEEDKPPVVLKDKDRKAPIMDKAVPIENTVTPPAPLPQPVPVAPIREQPVPQEQWHSFTFYGTAMKVRIPANEQFTLADCSEQSVGNAWQQLSGAAYNNTIRDCLTLRLEKNLGDWAYLNMLSQMAESSLGKGNSATLLTAFLFCQSGYKMRLASANGQLCMLYASNHYIYGTDYFLLNGEKYYLFKGGTERMHICTVDFPQEKPLSLLMAHQPTLDVAKTAERTLASKRYTNVKATLTVNMNLIDFYNSYPSSSVNENFMTRWAMYANTPLDETVKNSLYPALRECVKGLSEKEAVERLLNWVQTAFVYEYDEKVWGHDRAFFAEESLYYPYCDCEDRSILLSRLVRDLLGLKVVLVYYPGHLATAIHFSNPVQGDYLMLDSTRYTVCDPTYIGASIGMTMPGMDNNKATVILLE